MRRWQEEDAAREKEVQRRREREQAAWAEMQKRRELMLGELAELERRVLHRRSAEQTARGVAGACPVGSAEGGRASTAVGSGVVPEHEEPEVEDIRAEECFEGQVPGSAVNDDAELLPGMD